MDIGKAFGFAFEDEEWGNKLLLGAAITLIPIFGGFALMGYGVAIVRKVMAGESRPLPTWDNLGDYFKDGLLVGVVTLIYSLQIWIFACPITAVWILPAIAGEQEDWMAILTGVAGITTAGLSCLMLLYGLLLALLTPVVQIRFAATGDIGACLRIGEVFRFLFAHIGDLIVSQVLLIVAGVVVTSVIGGVAGFLGIIPICGWVMAGAIGLLTLPVSVWLTVFSGHLYGQIGRRAELASAPTV